MIEILDMLWVVSIIFYLLCVLCAFTSWMMTNQNSDAYDTVKSISGASMIIFIILGALYYLIVYGYLRPA